VEAIMQEAGEENHSGCYGLKNVNDRLKILYGEVIG
jgi:sensor histidine kinase YesM